VQQSLTAEAAAVVKQAVSLARRRGNAQVTPLHVASAMLAAPAGLLRAACLRSHSHPLQCKALELCFNVALNRLPASAAVASSPLLGGHGAHHHHYYPPSLSNALVAAFKRAQAHQRRGSVESQQQPVLAVKIELEQLVVSILDDPSVSRVMREAGFSSTQVKANVEQAVCSTASTTAATGATPNSSSQNPNPSSCTASTSPAAHQEAKAAKLPLHQVRDEDVSAILDCLASRSKRKVAVIAESAAAAEAMAHAAVNKVRRGEAKHDALRGAQVVSLRVSSFRDAPREEAERRLGELRCLSKGRRQVLLVVEDLKWAADFWAGHVQSGRRGYYSSVERVVTELRALACGGEHSAGGVCWLLGFGTYQGYMKCRAGQPSLESLWGLQTLTVPGGSLALSLTCAFDDR
jgi:ATP-dependent Clp protease ATP-binding subunit ClpA